MKRIIFAGMVTFFTACGQTSVNSSLLDSSLSPLGVWEQSHNGIVERINISEVNSTWFKSVQNRGTATTSFNLQIESSSSPGHMTFTVTNISVTGGMYPEFKVLDVFKCNYKVEGFSDGQWFSRQCGSANAPDYPSGGAWKGYKKSL